MKNRNADRATRIIWGCAALAMLITAGIFMFPLLSHTGGDVPANSDILDAEMEPPVELTISCVGDIMVHKPQLTAQYDTGTGAYDFTNNFEYVADYIKSADLALCNVETTFRGAPYSGYPLFNAPEELAAALKNTGFDVAITANNHMMDTGFTGMQRTIKILRDAGLVTTGSRYEGEKDYAMAEAKGVKIAVMAYTYETPSVNGKTTINGNAVSEEAERLINSFNYSTVDEDLQQLQNSIQSAKNEGAELIICYFHWGEEYQRWPNEWQQSIAAKAAEMGADMIFASHPHVLQGIEMIPVGDLGKQVPVFYSMGNFISNQRQETLDNHYTEQGMIATVHLSYMRSTGQILDIYQEVVPTWVDKYYTDGGKPVYTIIPLDKNLAANPILKTSGNLKRAQDALEDVKDLLELEEWP